MPASPHRSQPSPWVAFTRAAWKRRRDRTPLTLTRADLDRLRGVNEPISLAEVSDIYLPLSRLLNLQATAPQALHRAVSTFLGHRTPKVPYVIGVAGSVAVGKSTAARVLQALLARWAGNPRVDLVTTDGFLYPNQTLARRGLMQRKGFPESYNLRRLVDFLAAVKSGRDRVAAPVYSHLTYDILPGRRQVVRRPDILILEGLTVLHTGTVPPDRGPRAFVSDFFDFAVYIDAPERYIRRWFVDRFLTFRRTAFRDPRSYFRRFADLSAAEARRFARQVWGEINGKNLRENILPTRSRADLILVKGPDHAVQRVLMRRL